MFGNILGGVASGLIGLVGGERSNAANAKQAANQMNFQANQADQSERFQWDVIGRQEAFQKDSIANQEAFQREMFANAKDYATQMSNTSYQRGMQDMRAAGLNPILAYGQGGATSPTVGGGSGASSSGATGSRPAMQGARAQIQDALSPAISRALQGAMAATQLEQAMANVDLTHAQEAATLKGAGLTRLQQATEYERRTHLYEQQERERRRNAAGGPEAEVESLRAGAGLSNARTVQQQEETGNYRNYGPPGGWRSHFQGAESILGRLRRLFE